jgi:hypothetical protein
MFGFVKEFLQDDNSPTGFCLKMIIDREGDDIHTFPVTEKVFNMQFDPHFDFPLIGEYCFNIQMDKNRVITKLEPAVKGSAKAAYSFGSPKTVGSVITIGDGYIEFTDFEEQYKEGRLVYYKDYKLLNAREVKKGMRISLSKDVTIYCLDWTKDETTLSPVDMEFLKNVVSDNVYWMDIQNLYGDNDEYDCILIFRNYEKDENALDGDLSKKNYTREQLTKPRAE